MSDHIFLCIHTANQGDEGGSRLRSFPNMQEADAHIRDWLSRSCGLDCYRPGAEEARLRGENGGALPEMAFCCPKLERPIDLEGYSGFHCFDSGGTISLFLSVIYDEKSAAKFRGETIKGFELDKTLSDEADELIDMLRVLEDSFRVSKDYTEALEKVDKLIANQGLSLF